MNKLGRFVLISLTIFATLYLSFSFIVADFDIKHWPSAARGMVGTYSLLASAIVALILYYEKSGK